MVSKKKLKKRLIKNFKLYEFDMVGYKITKKNQLTMHHIFKKVYGEWIPEKDNITLLTHKTHCYLHYLEHEDRARYNHINEQLKEQLDSKKAPNKANYDKYKVLRKEITDYYDKKNKK